MSRNWITNFISIVTLLFILLITSNQFPMSQRSPHVPTINKSDLILSPPSPAYFNQILKSKRDKLGRILNITQTILKEGVDRNLVSKAIVAVYEENCPEKQGNKTIWWTKHPLERKCESLIKQSRLDHIQD